MLGCRARQRQTPTRERNRLLYFDSRLWRFTEGVRLRIAATVAIGLLATVFGVARLGLLGWLIGLVFEGAALDEVVLPAVGIAMVMVLRGTLDFARTMMAHDTAAKVQAHLRKLLYDKVVELGPAHFGLTRTGGVIVTMVDGVEQLETYFGQYLPQLLVAALTPLVIFLCLAFLDLPIALIMLCFALATLVAPAAFHGWDAENSKRRQVAYAAFAAEFLDAIQGLATLKAFGQSRPKAKLLASRARELFRSTMWVLATNSLARGITDTGIAAGAAVTLAYGAWRVVGGEMELTVLLVVLMLGTEVFRPLRDLRSLLHQGMVGQSAAQGVLEILNARPSILDAPEARPLQAPLAPTIEFDDVHFAYPGGRQPAHRGLSFKVDAGERVGIVGPSGSGKSSVVRLLLRLYDVDAGAVRIGGRDLRELRQEDVRKQLAVVNQDTYLFHGTVEDNLRFGKPEASQEELEAAARAANAHDFIMRLPQGYGTVIGERGIRLSGGQRQRIAIARALLRDAPILVLDEALSAVDAENEAVIQEALDRLMQGRTTLILAHRLSSVIDADRILVIDQGHVAESGRHDDLMVSGGAYYALMGEQARDRAPGSALVTGETDDDSEKPPEDLLVGTGRLAATEPTDAIIRAEGMGWGQVIVELLRMVAPWRGKLMLTFFFGVTRVVAFIGVGVLGALAVAAIKQDEPYGHFLWSLAVVAPLSGVLHWLESWIAHDMAFRLLAEMRIALFEQLARLAPAYLVRRRTGDLVAAATQDVEMVEYFFAHTIAPAFVAVLVPSVVLATLFAFGWQMALALLPFLALVASSPFLMRNRVDQLASRAREALGDLNAHAVDTVQGLAEVIAFEQTARRGGEFVAQTERHHRVRLPFFRDLTAQMHLMETATGLGGLAVVLAGGALAAEGALGGGLLPMFTLLAMAAFLPISEIAHIGRQLADTLGATRRLYAIDNEEVAVQDGAGLAAPRSADAPALEMRDVSFAYFGGNRRALDHVGFSAASGETVALVGPSGAGKTTVAHLLLRFWDPDTGSVAMDGHDLRDYRLDDLRRRIALVAQDTYLFNDTLAANIGMARPSATPKELDDAVRRAALGDFVASLPQGLETPVGERGMQLSGGQRQRVAIARAFLKDAPVLILDEATSHLDAVSERAIRHALEELMRARTTIVIAHRLSTVRSADQIVVLDSGRIVETGTHVTLLTKGGLYARLVAHQLTAAAAAE